MSTRGVLLLSMVAVAGWVIEPVARADGMVFRTPVAGAVQKVEVGAQRGLIWRTPDALEVWIEPVYAWEGDDAGAWVIPLPALPEVKEGDPKVLDDLDALTAPTFVSVCWEPDCSESCGWFGCLGGGGKSGGLDERTGEVERQDPAVTVWSSGTVGALDYEVISATTGNGATAWLAANGYTVGESAAQALATLDTEGLFFFVARVEAPPEPGQSLAPVRFVFAHEVLPFYPVRLTSAALDADTHLDVTLWLISTVRLLPLGDEAVLAGLDYPNTPKPDPDTYETSIANKLSSLAKGGFVIEYAGVLSEARAYGNSMVGPTDCSYDVQSGRVTHCADAWGNAWCEGECGTLDPVTLTSDLKQRVREAETPYAVRLRGRLPAGTRATEWAFTESTEYEHWELDGATGVYVEDRGDCFECPPAAGLFCEPAATRPSAPGPALLTLLAVLALLGGVRRTKKHG